MFKTKLIVPILILVAFFGFVGFRRWHNPNTSASSTVNTTKNSTSQQTPPVNYCSSNAQAKAVIVSISKQHMWDCQADKTVYDNAVITGMELYVADLTPTGTYSIYAKSTAQTLAGSDHTGSWSDFVNYWMPFLDNQYGTYGFHDLTTTDNGVNGRADSDFGHVNINAPFTAAKHASHGCVEMPLTAAKWLYDWAPVGTTVVVQS